MTARAADAALRYAALSWPVIPLHTPVSGGCSCTDPKCEHPGKHPRTLHGLKDASTDEAKIRKWWEKWPTANIGIAIPPGLVALDVDGDEGDAALRAGSLEIPPTVATKTGRGWHFIFRTKDSIRPKVNALPHVDLRGPGSYIVAPPSLHATGKRYEWIAPPESTPIAEAPAWLVMLAGNNGNGHQPAVPAGDSIPQGQRNRTLASLGGTMRKRGMSPAAIEAALLTDNDRCVPPLPESDVRRIARSVSRYEPAARAEAPQGGPHHGGPILEEMDIRKMLREGIPKPVFDVEDFLVRRSLTYLTGNPKGYKTWIALSWAVALASGSTWAGLQTRGDHRIVFLEAESPMQIPERFHRLCLAHQVDPERVLERLRFISPPSRLRLEFPDHFAALRRMVEAFRATWIVIDSFVRIHGSDENSSRDMAALANVAFLPLRDQCGCGVLILDHPPKPLHEGTRTRKEQIRGSWEKLAAADVQVHVESRETETGKIAAVSVGASRLGPERDEPLFIRLRDTINGGTMFQIADAPDNPTPGRPPKGKEQAIAIIRAEKAKNPALTFTEAVKACTDGGLSRATAGRAWEEIRSQVSEVSEGVLRLET